MFKAYVSQVKTSKPTGDVSLALEILQSAENEKVKQEAMGLDHKEIVVLSLQEFNTYMNIIQLHEDMKKLDEPKEIKDDFGTEDNTK